MFQPKITKEEINALPVVAFGGEITVVDDLSQVEAAVAELRKSPVVGIDTETKPTFVRGQKNKVALVQISADDRCFLFRLNKIDFPPALEEFLKDKSVKKVGLALRDDMAGLNKRHKFRPANILDLQNEVKYYGILELGLQKLYAIVFGEKISKSQQLSNWENPVLTEPQRRYAATDAWACLRIYRRLETLPRLAPAEVQALEAEYAPPAPSLGNCPAKGEKS